MLYTYRCEICGDFEVEKSMFDPAPKTCPNSHGPIRRVWTVPFVHYRGSGFYTNDKALYERVPDYHYDSYSGEPCAPPP